MRREHENHGRAVRHVLVGLRAGLTWFDGNNRYSLVGMRRITAVVCLLVAAGAGPFFACIGDSGNQADSSTDGPSTDVANGVSDLSLEPSTSPRMWAMRFP